MGLRDSRQAGQAIEVGEGGVVVDAQVYTHFSQAGQAIDVGEGGVVGDVQVSPHFQIGFHTIPVWPTTLKPSPHAGGGFACCCAGATVTRAIVVLFGDFDAANVDGRIA